MIGDMEIKNAKKLSEVIRRIRSTERSTLIGSREEHGLIDPTTDGDERLCCPGCGGDGHLHQQAIISIWRDSEDEAATLTLTSRRQVMVERIGSKEAPGRRDSMYILFTCEICDGCESYKVLEIMQHKGVTLAAWRGDLEV